eukprot:gene16411-biopygen8006
MQDPIIAGPYQAFESAASGMDPGSEGTEDMEGGEYVEGAEHGEGIGRRGSRMASVLQQGGAREPSQHGLRVPQLAGYTALLPGCHQPDHQSGLSSLRQSNQDLPLFQRSARVRSLPVITIPFRVPELIACGIRVSNRSVAHGFVTVCAPA